MSNIFLQKYFKVLFFVFVFLFGVFFVGKINIVKAVDPLCCPAVDTEGGEEIVACEFFSIYNGVCEGKIESMDLGGGSTIEGGYAGDYHLVKWGPPISCFENKICTRKIPSFEEGSVVWSGSMDNFNNIPNGETRTVTLTVTPKSGYSGPVTVTCPKCGQAGKTMIQSGSQVAITLNSSDYWQFSRPNLPVSDSFDFIVSVKTTATGNANKISLYSIPFDIVKQNCNQMMDGVNPCDVNKNNCFVLNGFCQSRLDDSLCKEIKDKEKCQDALTGSKVCKWNESTKQCLTAVQSTGASSHETPTGYTGALPPCAFSGTCRDINDLLGLIVNFGTGMFYIMGAFAFAFFVYGGFTMVTSMGNAEKTKKGRDILIAVVIGLVIALGAYTLIKFMLDVIGVAPTFRAL